MYATQVNARNNRVETNDSNISCDYLFMGLNFSPCLFFFNKMVFFSTYCTADIGKHFFHGLWLHI